MHEELIERIEAATADNAELMIECYHVAHGGRLFADPGDPAFGHTYERWRRFRAMLDAKAYESAALTLVPEGCVWTVLTDYGLPGRARIHNVPEWTVTAEAATPALAIASASLRAQANREGEG